MNPPLLYLLGRCGLILLLLSGCATRQREAPPAPVFHAAPEAAGGETAPGAPLPDSEREQEQKAAEALKRKLSRRSGEIARLRLQLLEKQAEINQLLNAHERALQEAARSKARLRSLNGKADAIAKLAEATLLVDEARARGNGDDRQTISHAEDLLTTGRQELEAGNYGGAAYLAEKARGLLQAADQATGETADGGATLDAEVVFATPLHLRVKKQSNVRQRPGRDSRVLFQLPKGAEVRALGYSGRWIHLVDGQQREGWIYYYLLES